MKDIEEALDLELQNEMEALQPYISPTASKEDVIRKMESCPICGYQLHFTYFVDFSQLVTNEVARCHECNYRAGKGLKKLQ